MSIPNCYHIMDVSELEKHLTIESRTWRNFDVQLKTNLAFIYYLKSGQVVLLPGNMRKESKGILFENKQCYDDCLSKDHFPIENSEVTVFGKHQEDILNLKSRITSILHHLETLGNNYTKKNSLDMEDLSLLLQQLHKKKNKLSITDKFYTALALGEYLRCKMNATWLLLKYYGDYNPYYIPALHYSSNDQILLILNVFRIFFDDPDMTPDRFTNLEYIKEPGFSFQTLKYTKYPDPYIELK